MAHFGGPYPAQELALLAVFGVVWPRYMALWTTQLTHHVFSYCGIVGIALDSTFLPHCSVIVRQWIERGVDKSPCQHSSFFCHIIEPPQFLSYQDILPFARWCNFNAELSSFSPQGHNNNLCSDHKCNKNILYKTYVLTLQCVVHHTLLYWSALCILRHTASLQLTASKTSIYAGAHQNGGVCLSSVTIYTKYQRC